jgi:hypothetical protein
MGFEPRSQRPSELLGPADDVIDDNNNNNNSISYYLHAQFNRWWTITMSAGTQTKAIRPIQEQNEKETEKN